MRFVYDDEKAADAAFFLLRAAGGSMEQITLLALLYLADRRTFLETGYPITGAKMVSSDNGPVLSEVLAHLSWGEPTESAWSRRISAPIDFRVSAREYSGELSHLSEYDEDILGQEFAQYGGCEPWDLVRFMRTLPEWRDPDGAAIPIDARVILTAAGRSDDDIEGTASLVEGIRAMRLSAVLSR